MCARLQEGVEICDPPRLSHANHTLPVRLVTLDIIMWDCLQIDNVDHVSWLVSKVSTLAGERLEREGRPLTLIRMCESGMGLLNLK